MLLDMSKVIAVVMAGGGGTRLRPLTQEMAKPAVPFGGKWRIIDFILSSIINSKVFKTLVLTQIHGETLRQHVHSFGFDNPMLGSYVRCVSPKMTQGNEWYRGTADAVFQNLDLIEGEKGIEDVLVLGGDHIYTIDLRQLYAYHLEKKAKLTICATIVALSEASNFGVIEVNEDLRIIGFEEKPEHPKEIPGMPGFCFASMGSYVADLPFLADVLRKDSKDISSEHDFGKDIIPYLVERGEDVFLYDFVNKNKITGQDVNSWIDAGRIGEYHFANMDLVKNKPELNLYNLENWPIRTVPDNLPPAKVVRNYLDIDGAPNKEKYRNSNCISSGGCIFDAPLVLYMSVFHRNARVEFGSMIEESVVHDGVIIGENVRIKKAIICENVVISRDEDIGYDYEKDKARGLEVKDGITVVPCGYIFK